MDWILVPFCQSFCQCHWDGDFLSLWTVSPIEMLQFQFSTVMGHGATLIFPNVTRKWILITMYAFVTSRHAMTWESELKQFRNTAITHLRKEERLDALVILLTSPYCVWHPRRRTLLRRLLWGYLGVVIIISLFPLPLLLLFLSRVMDPLTSIHPSSPTHSKKPDLVSNGIFFLS